MKLNPTSVLPSSHELTIEEFPYTQTPDLHARFDRLAKWAARVTGRPFTFLVAISFIAVWLVTGPVFQFNDTLQLVINTGTTIVTFRMAFLIQNTQNRDSAAAQIKTRRANPVDEREQNALLDLEELGE